MIILKHVQALTWPLHLLSSTHQSGPLFDPGLTVFHQFIQVGFVVLRAVVCGPVQRVSDLHLLYLIHLRDRSIIVLASTLILRPVEFKETHSAFT